MAKDAEQQKEIFYKLSPKAVQYGFLPTWIDGALISALPETTIYRNASNGQNIVDEVRTAEGIVKNGNGAVISRTENGFVNLTPQQVYELTTNGVITLSNKRPEHSKIYFDYLKANCTIGNGEDY